MKAIKALIGGCILLSILCTSQGQESPVPGLPGTCPAFSLSPNYWIACDMSTKTDYYPQQLASNYTPAPEGCSAVHIEYVARHGSRMPSGGDIPKLSQLATVLQQNAEYISNPEYAWMKTWVDPYTAATSNLLLIPDGANEHFYTAKRMLENYPGVYNTTYSPTTMTFQSSQISRSGQSGSSFAFSLLQNKGDIGGASKFVPYYIWTESPDEDLEIRFFDNCPAFQTQLNDPQTNFEAELFGSKYLPSIAVAVAQRMGSYPSFVPNATILTTMYTACEFDVAISNNTSLFCSLFNETEYETLNYFYDLGYYYQRGYGYDINWQQATLLLQDMYNNTACVVNKGVANCPVSKMRFGHAETIMPMVAILGLFKDPQPLMANWSPEQIRNRQWRTSVITPFASNTNMVLYSCPAQQSGPEFKVKVLVNEQEMQLPGCSSLYCSFDEFTQALTPNLSLNFDEVCKVTACAQAQKTRIHISA